MIRFAANLGFMFQEMPMPARFEAAARAGFRAVELLVPFEFAARDLARWAGDHGLDVLGFNMWPGRWADGERGIAALPGREQEFRDSVTQALEYADALGVPRFHPFAGIIPAGADRLRCRAVYRDNLALAAEAAGRHGRGIWIEPINQRDMRGYFLSTLADAEAIRADVGAANLTFTVDCYHTQVAEGDLTTKLRRYRDHIAHVQIAGVPDRHEPDEGEVNYAFIFDVLRDIGYDGWVGCEYRPRGGTADGLGWMRRFTAMEDVAS